MASKKEITCSVEFSDGAIQRITDAFVDLYYGILDGIYEGPLMDQKDTEDKTA